MITLRRKFAVRILTVIMLVAVLLFFTPRQHDVKAVSFPNLKFPWDKGQYKTLTVGLHGPYGPWAYWSVQPLAKLYALDFGGSFTVLAAGSGTVEDASDVVGCGPYGVRIRHNSTWSTEYCHLSRRYVRIGRWVPQGRPIGHTGNLGCGRCGVHLHFALRKNGRYETWDDKVVNGWRFHAVHYVRGGMIYGQATATRENTRWGLYRGIMSDAYRPRGEQVKAWIGSWRYTKVSSVTLNVTEGPFSGTLLGPTNACHSDFSFGSSNNRG